MKIVLGVLVVIVLVIAGLAWYVLGSMRAGAVPTVAKPTEDLSSTEEPQVITVISDDPTPSPTPMPIYEEEAKDEKIINILLVGTDSRSEDELESAGGRSDSMILASLNTKKGTISLVSFMRDSRVHRVGKSGRFTFYNRPQRRVQRRLRRRRPGRTDLHAQRKLRPRHSGVYLHRLRRVRRADRQDRRHRGGARSGGDQLHQRPHPAASTI